MVQRAHPVPLGRHGGLQFGRALVVLVLQGADALLQLGLHHPLLGQFGPQRLDLGRVDPVDRHRLKPLQRLSDPGKGLPDPVAIVVGLAHSPVLPGPLRRALAPPSAPRATSGRPPGPDTLPPWPASAHGRQRGVVLAGAASRFPANRDSLPSAYAIPPRAANAPPGRSLLMNGLEADLEATLPGTA